MCVDITIFAGKQMCFKKNKQNPIYLYLIFSSKMLLSIENCYRRFVLFLFLTTSK